MPNLAAAAETDPLYQYIQRVHDRLERPEEPVFMGACTPKPSSELRDLTAIALVFIGFEGWVISVDNVHDNNGFWVLGTMVSSIPGNAAGWEWTMGGVWISRQIAPIQKQLSLNGLKPAASASVEEIKALAASTVCNEPPPYPAPVD